MSYDEGPIYGDSWKKDEKSNFFFPDFNFVFHCSIEEYNTLIATIQTCDKYIVYLEKCMLTDNMEGFSIEEKKIAIKEYAVARQELIKTILSISKAIIT